MPLIGHINDIGGETGCASVSYSKQAQQNAYELHGWHTRMKCDHEDCMSVQKIIYPQIFNPRGEQKRMKEPTEELLDITPLRVLALHLMAQG